MKHKLLALVMALTVMSWAQTATKSITPGPQQNSAPAAHAKCPCCDKMAAGEMKCAHGSMQAKDSKEMEMAPGSKEGMSCVRAKNDAGASCCGKECTKDTCAKASGKDKTASCCGDRCNGDRCNKDGKNCCARKAGEKTAANCCQRGQRS